MLISGNCWFLRKNNMFWRKKRPSKNEYKCSICGQIHSEWPALTYSSPTNYFQLSEEEKATIANLDSDFCIINYEDQTDRFIRVTLSMKVIDSEEDLDYGLWVSLSEKSFNDYEENYNNPNHETTYFGWLCNTLPDYENTMSIPINVVTQLGDQRPKIFPHKDHDHQFVRDFYNGITSHEAQRRVDEMMKNS